MVKCLIVDDESSSLNVLSELIGLVAENLEIIGTASSVEESLERIPELKPDLVFLDIELKDKTAFDLLDQLGEIDFKIIFTTAHQGFAIKAFRASALDYLLKPIRPNQLKEAINRYKEAPDSPQNLDLLKENFDSQKGISRLSISTSSKIHYIDLEDLIYLKADGPYTEIFMTNNESVSASKTLRHFEELLPSVDFMRTHRSFIIRLDKVREFIKYSQEITMVNGAVIRLSDAWKDQFMTRMTQGL